MLDNVMIGRFYPINSNIHRMNPLAKIICTLIFIIVVFLSNDLVLNCLILGLTVLLTLMSNVPIKLYLKTILSLKYIVLFIVIINLIFRVDISIILIMIIRLIVIILYSSLLTLTTTPNDLTHGLEQLLSPLKIVRVPVSKMALSLTLALRFIPTLLDETKRVIKAQNSRGADYKGIKNKFLGIKSLLIPIITLSFKKADNLAETMEVRLYNINKTKSHYRVNKWRFFDFYMIAIHVIIMVLTILKEVVK